MSLDLLNVAFKIGRVLAVTPANTQVDVDAFPSTLQALFMVGIYSGGVFVSGIYRQPYYVSYSSLRLLIQVSLDALFYLLTIHSVVIGRWKKREWYQLLKNLKTTRADDQSTTRFGIVFFATGNILFVTSQIYETCIWAKVMGADFYKQYAIEYLQGYIQFFIYFLFYVLLKMFVLRYRSIAKILSQNPTKNNDPACSLHKIKHNVCVLGESVGIFNDLFGLSFLFTISFTSLEVLCFLKEIIVPTKQTVELVVYRVGFILWLSVGTFGNIFLCDRVEQEAEKILAAAHKRTNALSELGERENEELRQLISVLKDNFPTFSAARFFNINKKTIFVICNAIVTFLIVSIQLDTTQVAGWNDCEAYCNGTR